METKLKIGLGLLIITIILVSGWFVWNSQTKLSDEQGKTWVIKQITQCAEDWQSWVHERNKDKYKQSWEENKEYNVNLIKEGIKEFYQKRKIVIYDIKYEELEPEIHCEACDCLSDIRLYLLVSNEDVDYFLRLGFKK